MTARMKFSWMINRVNIVVIHLNMIRRVNIKTGENFNLIKKQSIVTIQNKMRILELILRFNNFLGKKVKILLPFSHVSV